MQITHRLSPFKMIITIAEMVTDHVERIKEDGCWPNDEGEEDDDRESPQCYCIEPWW